MESHLLSLPTELHILIFQLLRPITKHAFSLSCRQLWSAFTPSCPNLGPLERHRLRGLLAKDGFVFHNYSYCGGCHSLHLLAHFPPGQLDIPPDARRCMTQAKQMWLGSDKLYSFRELCHSYPKIQQNPIRDGSERAVIRCLFVPIMKQYGICSHYDIITLPDPRTVSKQQIGKILDGFDIPTCPHTWLSSPILKNSYNPSLPLVSQPVETLDHWLDQYETKGAHARCNFPECRTFFRWVVYPSDKRFGWKVLSLQVKRHIGSLLSPVEPMWMAQLAQIPDIARFDTHWQDCHQWKNVNMAIEEKRYWRELIGSQCELSQAEQVEFEQLRRENDYLRHPYRIWKHSNMGPHSRYISALQAPLSPEDDLPVTTQLILRESYNRMDQENVECIPGGGLQETVNELENSGDPWVTGGINQHRHIISDPVYGKGLLLPLWNSEAMICYGKASAKFEQLFNDIRTLSPLQRKLESIFWGPSDCLSPAGMLGLLVRSGVPIPRRLLINQFYRLPRFIKNYLGINQPDTTDSSSLDQSQSTV